MEKIHVVIDSTANVPAEMLVRHCNLHVVPLKVLMGGEEWSENELSCGALFTLAKERKVHPKTSQPAPGAFAKVFQPVAAVGCEIIVITIAGQLSGTVQSARTAVTMVTGTRIAVIDSGTTAMGMYKMAELALQMASAGADFADIVRRLERMADATHTMFIVDTLEYLHKGGRIGGAAALFGTILQIKPILYLAEGRVSVLDKVRTRPRALARMIDELKRYKKLSYVGIAYMENQTEAERLVDEVRGLFPEAEVFASSLGSVLGAHLGPGVVGIIYCEPV